jgi:hypothetical protein
MKLAMLLIMLAPICGGCVSYPPDPNVAELLRDCTVELGGWAGKPATDIPPEERKAILNAASQWAIRNEYLPCNVTVCGAVIDAAPGHVSVYLTGYGDLNPSAEIKLSRGRYRLLKEQFYHSACPGGVYGPTRGGT